MPGSFFDSNILLYIAGADDAKADRAEALIAEGGTICVQVLNEIAKVARRKMLFDWEEVQTLLSSIRGLLDVVPLTIEIHESGVALARRFKLSTYDAMIVAAALDAGCTTLWSEDMQHGLLINDRVRIRNPFRRD